MCIRKIQNMLNHRKSVTENGPLEERMDGKPFTINKYLHFLAVEILVKISL